MILLEAEPSLGLHSTGRSAALFMIGYGPASVQELTRRSEAEFTRLSALPGMPPLLTPRGGLFTAWDGPTAAALASMIARHSFMRDLTTEQALELCPALRTGDVAACGYDPDTRDIDVSALHAYYASALRGRGGQIVTSARFVAATRRVSGWEVRTDDGRRWRGDALVNAAGAWGDEVAELLRRRRARSVTAAAHGSHRQPGTARRGGLAGRGGPRGDLVLQTRGGRTADVAGG